MKYPYYQKQERCGLLLPFLAGALVSAPIAYLAGDKNTPEYVFPQQQYPQYPPQPLYVGPYYQQPYPMYQQYPQQMPYQPINQTFYTN